MKRTFEITVSTSALILLSPLLCLVSVLVKLTSPGPVLYRAIRVGKDGRLFQLYKFRSMTVGADQSGPTITARGDARVTPVGRWLRRLKLDELCRSCSTYSTQILPEKLAIEQDYLKNRSFLSDLKIILETLFALFTITAQGWGTQRWYKTA